VVSIATLIPALPASSASCARSRQDLDFDSAEDFRGVNYFFSQLLSGGHDRAIGFLLMVSLA